jgi:hypothetical protein
MVPALAVQTAAKMRAGNIEHMASRVAAISLQRMDDHS